MTQVNPPPQLRIPEQFSGDKELFGYFRQLNTILFQLWSRTGGDNDAIATLENGEVYEPGIQLADPDDIYTEIDDIEQYSHHGSIFDLIERVDGIETELSLIGETPMEFEPFDYALSVSRGLIPGVSGVNKFGRCADNVDSGIDTDIWDGSSAAIGNVIWDAPTTARIHDIVSDNVADVSAGAGARTIQVYGLTSWDTKETSEVVTMNGTTSVSTVNSYVIIHRMRVLTKGATSVNVGTISATAQTDATVTAYILPDEGQTQMAIYGIPSVQTLYANRVYASVNRANAASVDISFLFNSEPDAELTNFQVKGTLAVASTGSCFLERSLHPYSAFSGPGILKIQASSSANNTDVSAGFDVYLVDN